MLNITIKPQQVGKFILKTAMIGLFALLSLRGCDIALKKQAEVDYQECLSWQADGYDVQCRPIKE